MLHPRSSTISLALRTPYLCQLLEQLAHGPILVQPDTHLQAQYPFLRLSLRYNFRRHLGIRLAIATGDAVADNTVDGVTGAGDSGIGGVTVFVVRGIYRCCGGRSS